MYFLTISELRAQLSLLPTERVQILNNPATGKLFGVTEAGHTFKVQQDIDVKAKDFGVRARFMSETQGLTISFNEQTGKHDVSGCLIVPDDNKNVVASF